MIRGLSVDGRPDTGAPFEPILRHAPARSLRAGRPLSRRARRRPRRIREIRCRLPTISRRGTNLSSSIVFRRMRRRSPNSPLARPALSGTLPGLSATSALAYEQTIGSPCRVRDLAKWFRTHLSGLSRHYRHRRFACCRKRFRRSPLFVAALVEQTQNRWILATRSMFDLPVASWLAYAHLRTCGRSRRSGLHARRGGAKRPKFQDRPAAQKNSSRFWSSRSVGRRRSALRLQTSTRSVDLRHLASETREMIYQYLAQQVFKTLLAVGARSSAADVPAPGNRRRSSGTLRLRSKPVTSSRTCVVASRFSIVPHRRPTDTTISSEIF